MSVTVYVDDEIETEVSIELKWIYESNF
jgi:hypothetical protein